MNFSRLYRSLGQQNCSFHEAMWINNFITDGLIDFYVTSSLHCCHHRVLTHHVISRDLPVVRIRAIVRLTLDIQKTTMKVCKREVIARQTSVSYWKIYMFYAYKVRGLYGRTIHGLHDFKDKNTAIYCDLLRAEVHLKRMKVALEFVRISWAVTESTSLTSIKYVSILTRWKFGCHTG